MAVCKILYLVVICCCCEGGTVRILLCLFVAVRISVCLFVAVSTLVCLWLLGAYWCVCSSCEDNIVFV